MRPPARAALAALAACCSLACGSKSHTAESPGDGGGDDASVDAPATGDDAAVEGGFLGDGGTMSDCDPAASLIYVATEERSLYSFNPQTNVFTLLWDINCAFPGDGGLESSYVNSMAVDRSANAWINFGDGTLWKMNIKTGVCAATTFVVDQGGVALFGMGFAAKTVGSSDETLFIDDLGGGGLGFIDLTTMTLERFGPFTGNLAGASAELAGTGDARLFGFFAGSPLGDAGSASVTQIDPDSEGPLTQYPLPTVDTGSDWAFSFYAGDFYLYTADKYDENDPDTVVTRFRPSDGSVTVIDPQLGFRIVGAGSSTCVPTTPTQ